MFGEGGLTICWWVLVGDRRWKCMSRVRFIRTFFEATIDTRGELSWFRVDEHYWRRLYSFNSFLLIDWLAPASMFSGSDVFSYVYYLLFLFGLILSLLLFFSWYCLSFGSGWLIWKLKVDLIARKTEAPYYMSLYQFVDFLFSVCEGWGLRCDDDSKEGLAWSDRSICLESWVDILHISS